MRNHSVYRGMSDIPQGKKRSSIASKYICTPFNSKITSKGGGEIEIASPFLFYPHGWQNVIVRKQGCSTWLSSKSLFGLGTDWLLAFKKKNDSGQFFGRKSWFWPKCQLLNKISKYFAV